MRVSRSAHNVVRINWRASEASETVLGVDNAKSGICYIYLLGTEQSLITVAT